MSLTQTSYNLPRIYKVTFEKKKRSYWMMLTATFDLLASNWEGTVLFVTHF